ncbi:alpha/beta fold hydrolase [Candidatus Neomarinimicrobiota bacterium]
MIIQCSNIPDGTVISQDGVEISYNVQGKGKPAIVLIPGWTNSKTIWDDQISHFSEKYKVIAIDLAGHGKSANNRDKWTMSAYGDDVVAVVNKLRLKDVVLVGFSMGGFVVFEAEKKIPEKVSGIVLVDAFRDVEYSIPIELAEKQYNDLVEKLNNPSPEKFSGFKNNQETNYKRLLAMYEEFSTIGWLESLENGIRWRNNKTIKALQNVQSPLIAINSDLSPSNVEAFQKYVPSFKAHIVENTSHVIMWDAPDEFNRLLDEAILDFSK